jgi:hypothetical protein
VSQLIKYSCKQANLRGYRYWCERITTTENVIADSLSRYRTVESHLQDKRFGHHSLTHQFTRQEVTAAVQTVLGKLWNPSKHPQGYIEIP